MKVNIISAIVSNKGYDDVFDMLEHMATRCEKLYILCKESGDFKNHDNLEIVCPNQPLSGFKFWFWAYKESKKIISKADKNEKFVFLQLVAGIMAGLLKFKFGKRVLNGTYLVSAEYAYRDNEFWYADKNSQHLNDELINAYKKVCKKKSFIQKISAVGNDFIVGNSQLVIDDIEGKNCSKYVVNGNPLGERWFEEKPVLDRHIDFIYAGNLQPPKGLDTLFLAFKNMIDKGVSANLYIVGGTKPYEEKWFNDLAITVKDYPVEILGKVSPQKLQNLYNQSKIFVFPSFYEGSPRVVNEALCFNCDIIATDIPGVRSIDSKGEVINYFEAGNAEQLEQIMTKVLGNYKPISYQEFAKRFTADKIGDKFISVIEKELAKI